MAATPDQHDYDLEAHVQIKTASAWARHKWGESGSSDIPDDYRIQGQHEMAVTGARENVFAVLFADESTFRGLVWMAKAGLPVKAMMDFVNQLRRMEHSRCEFAVYPLKRNDQLIETIVEGERHFWETYVVPHVSPPDKSVPEKRTDIITASATQAAVIQQLRDAGDALDAAEEKVEQLTEHVKTMIGDNSGISAHGIGKVTYKAPKPKTTVDYKAVANGLRPSYPELYDILVKEHTTEKQASRAFRMHWAK